MHPPRNRNAYFTFTFFAAIFGLAIGAGGAYGVDVLYRANKLPFIQSHNISVCGTGAVYVCIESKDTNVDYTDMINLNVVVHNASQETYKATFSSTCTDPSIVIDGKEKIEAKICGAAITDVVIDPTKTVAYTVKLSAAELSAGTHKLGAKWSGMETPTVEVTRSKQSESDESVTDNDCYSGRANSYCTAITVVVKDGLYDDSTTVADLSEYYSALQLTPSTNKEVSIPDLGILTYYVPKDEADEWVAKFKELPQTQGVDR